jgi:hypothetical protein
MTINQESKKNSIFHLLEAYFVSLGNPYNNKNLLAFFRNLFKSTLNMWLFNIIDINSKNMFILIIKLNNNLKFDMLRLDYGYFTFFLTRIMKCILDDAFTHLTLVKDLCHWVSCNMLTRLSIWIRQFVQQ